jgi:hypothetical protein
MAKDATRRAANYAYGLNPTRIAEDISAKRVEMCHNQQKSATDQYQTEQLVLAVLGSEPGIDTTQYAFYMSFAKSVLSMQGRIPGGAGLNNSVEHKRQYWIAKGLSDRVLARVRDEVFSIPAPEPPPSK